MDQTISPIIEKRLSSHPEIAFAYLHGSFLTSERPGDVDVAVFLRKETYEELSEKGETHMGFAIPLEMELEKALNKTADVQILNGAPLSFRHRVVQRGVLIIDNDVDLRCGFEYLSRYPFFDFQLRRAMYLQEALS